jgi:hypothetical protein
MSRREREKREGYLAMRSRRAMARLSRRKRSPARSYVGPQVEAGSMYNLDMLRALKASAVERFQSLVATSKPEVPSKLWTPGVGRS